MTNASSRVRAVPLALLLGLAAPDAWASDRASTTAAVTIQGSVAVTILNTVVNNAPMQTLLLTAAIAPMSAVFTVPGSSAGVGSVSVGAPGGATGSSGLGAPSSAGALSATGSDGSADAGPSGSPGNSGTGDGSAQLAGAGLSGADEGGPPALIVIGGSLTGTTIDGDAISVNVSDASGGSAAGSAKVPVVIAQYN